MFIHPAPSDEELAAIVAAVSVLRGKAAPAEGGGNLIRPELSRWARAGRLEAMRGLGCDGDR